MNSDETATKTLKECFKANDPENGMLGVSQKKLEKIPGIKVYKIMLMTNEENKNKAQFSKRNYAKLKRKNIMKEKHCTCSNFRRVENIYNRRG